MAKVISLGASHPALQGPGELATHLCGLSLRCSPWQRPRVIFPLPRILSPLHPPAFSITSYFSSFRAQREHLLPREALHPAGLPPRTHVDSLSSTYLQSPGLPPVILPPDCKPNQGGGPACLLALPQPPFSALLERLRHLGA